MESETEFIEKWRGDESGEWVQSACALYWARSYHMPTTTLFKMSKDYMSVPIRERASCSHYLARRVLESDDNGN